MVLEFYLFASICFFFSGLPSLFTILLLFRARIHSSVCFSSLYVQIHTQKLMMMILSWLVHFVRKSNNLCFLNCKSVYTNGKITDVNSLSSIVSSHLYLYTTCLCTLYFHFCHTFLRSTWQIVLVCYLVLRENLPDPPPQKMQGII